MKHLIYALAALSLTLAACATTSPGPATTPPPASSTGGEISLRVTQAYAASLEAYTVAANGYLLAVDAGLLKEPQKAQAKATLTRAYDGLEAAKRFRDARNGSAMLTALTNVDALVAQAKRLIPAAR